MDKVIEKIGNTTTAPTEATQRVPVGYNDADNWDEARDRFVELTLTQTQLLALRTNPVELIAPQGNNTIILPVYCVGELDHNGTDYAAANDIILKYDNGVDTTDLIISKTTISATEDSISISANVSEILVTSQVKGKNVALTVASDITNAGGPITIRVYYKVVELNT